MLNLPHRKMFLLFLLAFTGIVSFAQQTFNTRYYDSSFIPVSKDSAFFYGEMAKEGNLYNFNVYWMRSKKVKSVGSYADTNLAKPVGLNKGYYENGAIEDSSYFYESGKLKNIWHFYPDGKLFVRHSYNAKNNKETTEAFQPNGTTIPDFVYQREAAFGERSAWTAYLGENLKSNIPVKKGAPEGTYLVVVRFVVGKDGKVQQATAETNYGFGMEEEALRVINKSPKWQPAIYLGKTLPAYRRQPITFVVEGSSKKK